MNSGAVHFSIAADAAWAPGIETREAWQAWSTGTCRIEAGSEPKLAAMPPMLRRRTGMPSKMALEVAYQCLGDQRDVPTVFCSRHGEVQRSVALLSDLARGEPLSPTAFGMSVHNAAGGLFSIARADHANNIALSAGKSGVEHAVIEACGLLQDGEAEVLLVVYDGTLPAAYAAFRDEDDVPYAWAWLMRPAGETNTVSLSWCTTEAAEAAARESMPAGLAILRFHVRGDRELERTCDARRWRWVRDA